MGKHFVIEGRLHAISKKLIDFAESKIVGRYSTDTPDYKEGLRSENFIVYLLRDFQKIKYTTNNNDNHYGKE